VSTSSSAPAGARFDRFSVDLSSGELLRSGVRVPIQGQPFQVLRLLLEADGKVVTREELRQALWREDTFVDFELGVNTAVKKLRQALEDSAEHPKFVETLPKLGYRFMIPVEWVPDIAMDPGRSKSSSFQHGVAVATSLAQPKPWQRLSTRTAVLGGLTACALALSFLYYGHSSKSKAGQPVVIPLVTNAGQKFSPSLSPDGQHLAFAWNGGAGPYFSLYVKLVGTEEPLRLTKEASIDFNPVWSPDGRYIAFGRILKGETGIYIIPASGGAERRVRKTLWEEQELYEVFWQLGRLSWSPDGKVLAFSDHASHNEHASSIFLLSLDSLEVRRLTSPLFSSSDFSPEFSPDGQTLAFNRSLQVSQSSIYTVPVSGGEEQSLVSGVECNWGLAWTPDGRDIVFAKAGPFADDGSLWKISLRGGESERLRFGEEGVEPSIRGSRLVYVRQKSYLNISRRNLNSLLSARPPDRFISSTKTDSGPQFSPDGTKIAFESSRSGYSEVWMCQSDGSGLLQLTHFNFISGTPRWSPDGQQITFDSIAPGNGEIFVMDSRGGLPRRLTTEPSHDAVPSWSRDGRWIYFASDRTGRWEVWKMPPTGGPALQVTRHGGFAAFESLDGKFLYYAKGLTLPGLWRIPTKGGEEVELINSLGAGYWGNWAVVDNGIYYLDTTAKPGIAFFNIITHRTTRVFDVENRPVLEQPGLAVSPDKSTILYTQLDALNSDILLVENFQ
jgi:Tol biopolymer transport system component/DNA-binding winged helix-turn-helix (wHTH) protein